MAKNIQRKGAPSKADNHKRSSISDAQLEQLNESHRRRKSIATKLRELAQRERSRTILAVQHEPTPQQLAKLERLGDLLEQAAVVGEPLQWAAVELAHDAALRNLQEDR